MAHAVRASHGEQLYYVSFIVILLIFRLYLKEHPPLRDSSKKILIDLFQPVNFITE
jgi:hypothetical protein